MCDPILVISFLIGAEVSAMRNDVRETETTVTYGEGGWTDLREERNKMERKENQKEE